MSQTRWFLRYHNCKSFTTNFDVLIATLNEIQTPEALNLQVAVLRAPVILTVNCIELLFESIHIASAQLQSTSTDIGSMATIIKTLREKLKDLKEGTAFDELYEQGHQLCVEFNVTLQRP